MGDPLPSGSRIDRFLLARRRSLAAVMFCYLFYYTGRQSFGFAIPGIQAELGLDKQALGWVSAALLWAYAGHLFLACRRAGKKRRQEIVGKSH